MKASSVAHDSTVFLICGLFFCIHLQLHKFKEAEEVEGVIIKALLMIWDLKICLICT